MAVLLVNKRGMGQSEGNYVKNDMQGRADDLYAAVQSIQGHPSIDADNIGLIGHSQGGWVVGLTAAQHSDIAFFISLAGPTTTVLRNVEDNYWHAISCQGYEGEELDAKVAQKLRLAEVAVQVGELTDFGMFGFDARVFPYDPADALQTVESPGLLIYAENDDQVTPQLNLDRLDELFDGNPPDRLTTVVIDDATHAFRLVNDPCESWVDVPDQPRSEELVVVLNDWLEDKVLDNSSVDIRTVYINLSSYQENHIGATASMNTPESNTETRSIIFMVGDCSYPDILFYRTMGLLAGGVGWSSVYAALHSFQKAIGGLWFGRAGSYLALIIAWR